MILTTTTAFIAAPIICGLIETDWVEPRGRAATLSTRFQKLRQNPTASPRDLQAGKKKERERGREDDEWREEATRMMKRRIKREREKEREMGKDWRMASAVSGPPSRASFSSWLSSSSCCVLLFILCSFFSFFF